MYELRILSGLHRGATLPLDERPYSIGATEDADVVLVDPEIEPKHALLSIKNGSWSLTSVDGSVHTAHSNHPQSAMDLAPGDFARVGSIWITVVDQDARWKNPPPEPVDELFDATVEESLAVTEEETAPFETATPAHAQPGKEEPVPVGRFTAIWRQMRSAPDNRSRMKFVLLCMVAIGCAAATFAVAYRPPTMHGAQKPAVPQEKSSGKLSEPTIAKAFDSLHADGTSNRAPTPAELSEAFRKRLSDSDLLKRFDLKLQDGQWFMQASLDDEEAARFERVLAGFIDTHNIQFPVHAVVGSGESMLPFKIRQVISGSNASVVTQEGNQLYVGDEFRGVRLTAIRGSRITFAGKRKIEVIW